MKTKVNKFISIFILFLIISSCVTVNNKNNIHTTINNYFLINYYSLVNYTSNRIVKIKTFYGNNKQLSEQIFKFDSNHRLIKHIYLQGNITKFTKDITYDYQKITINLHADGRKSIWEYIFKEDGDILVLTTNNDGLNGYYKKDNNEYNYKLFNSLSRILLESTIEYSPNSNNIKCLKEYYYGKLFVVQNYTYVNNKLSTIEINEMNKILKTILFTWDDNSKLEKITTYNENNEIETYDIVQYDELKRT